MVLIPLATRPAHPRYWRFTPAVASPAFSCPVSSIAPITSPARGPRRAAASRPLTANRRTTPIAAKVSQLAWFSSRCVRSGVRSPPCREMLHPFTRGSSLASADTYLPACSHGSVRAKHGDAVLQLDDLAAPPGGRAPGPVHTDPAGRLAAGLRPRGRPSGLAAGRLWGSWRPRAVPASCRFPRFLRFRRQED